MRNNLPVGPLSWRAYHRDWPDGGVKAEKHPVAGITIPFPVSPLPDPDATPPWLGYVLGCFPKNLITQNKHPTPISGKTLCYQFQLLCNPDEKFNYKSDPDNFSSDVPARFTPMITGPRGRWWARINFELHQTIKPEILRVPMTDDCWFQVDGANADVYDGGKDFHATLARPSYYGMTFGGGFFSGHGVSANAPATFNLLKIWTE